MGRYSYAESLRAPRLKWSLLNVRPAASIVPGHIPGSLVVSCAFSSTSVILVIASKYLGSPVNWDRRVNSRLRDPKSAKGAPLEAVCGLPLAALLPR